MIKKTLVALSLVSGFSVAAFADDAEDCKEKLVKAEAKLAAAQGEEKAKLEDAIAAAKTAETAGTFDVCKAHLDGLVD